MAVTARSAVAMGASAGGVEALRTVVAGLPIDLPAAVLVVLHMPSSGTSVLGRILDRAGPLPAHTAEHGAPIEPGTVYVAPVNRHLMLAGDRIALSGGPRENGHRPAIDVLFRSAAHTLRDRAIGVILSGNLDDGVAGLGAIASRGGTTVVQDPDDAQYRAMPENALRSVRVDHVTPAAKIGPVLADVLARPPHTQDPPEPLDAWADERLPARDAQTDEAERALWVALRTLDEKARLGRRILDTLGESPTGLVDRYRQAVQECEEAADALRRMLRSGMSTTGE